MVKHLIEKTVVIVKPDGVQRALIGEIIHRIEKTGIKLSAIKMVLPTRKILQEQYRMTDAWIKKLGDNSRAAFEAKGIKVTETNEEIAKRVREWNIQSLLEGPVVAMVWEGFHSIEICRKIVGHTEPRQALPGTIRGDYTTDSYDLSDVLQRPIRNIVHASGNKDEAENEIKIWFNKDEIQNYSKKDWETIHKHNG